MLGYRKHHLDICPLCPCMWMTCIEGTGVPRTLHRHMPHAAVYAGLHVSRGQGYQEHCNDICRMRQCMWVYMYRGGTKNIASTYAACGSVCGITQWMWDSMYRGDRGTQNIVSTYAAVGLHGSRGQGVPRTLYRHMPHAAVYVVLHVSRGQKYQEHCIDICYM